jgi:UDP-N-acetylmuramate dehydrogenase
MNAGGHGSDIAASLVAATYVDLALGTEVTVGAGDLSLGYRSSAVAPHQIVTSARFALVPGDAEEGRQTIREIVRWRRQNQPGGQNAGSVFTNPAHDAEGRSAGWLIDAAGCKGRRRGSAMVSPKHANFIQADSGGAAADVAALIEEVRAAVAERFGITLHTELRMAGFEGPGGVSTSSRGGR